MHHEEELDRTHVPLPVVHAAVDELGYKIHGRGSMVSAVGGGPCPERAVQQRLAARVLPLQQPPVSVDTAGGARTHQP